jgi:hypothetical protein
MKRDMDLARKLLLAAEANETTHAITVTNDDYTADQVNYHIRLLDEAGLIVGAKQTTMDRKETWAIARLTWQGHEFLDAARDPGIWSRAQSAAATVGGLGYALLLPLLIEMGKAQLKAAGILP